jgi:hypothetical protein
MQNRPWNIALDGECIYWTNRGSGGRDGAVVRAPKTGGSTTVLAQGLASPWSLVVAGAYVYWTNQDDGTVMRVPK